MKKFSKLLISLMLVMSLGMMAAACGNDDTKDNNVNSVTDGSGDRDGTGGTNNDADDSDGIADDVEDIGDDIIDGVEDIGDDVKDGLDDMGGDAGNDNGTDDGKGSETEGLDGAGAGNDAESDRTEKAQ